MFRRIVMLSLLTGLLAGLLTAPVQMHLVQPLIVEAERYEQQHEADEDHAAMHPAMHSEHAADEQHASEEPSDDATHRTLATVIALVVTAMGYALLLGACLALWGEANWRHGLILGALGFVTFQLAPALGLPPEPPGVPAADLYDRQLWWLLTVACTASGLFLLYQARQKARLLRGAAAVGLFVLPHLLGAPKLHGAEILAPAQLIESFMLASLVSAAVLWLSMGGILGALFQRFPAPQR